MTKSSLMRRHAKHASAVALSTLLLGACAVGPDYRNPPPVDMGSGWTQPSADAQARLAATDAGLPDIRARLRAATLGLGVLLGAPPERELALEAARRSYAHAQTRFKLGDIALTDLLAFTECTVLTPLTHIVVAHVPFETNRPFAAGRAGTPDAGLATLLVNHPVLDVATACERLGIS